MHVERYGHGGTPVVLLHGFGTSSFLWRAVAPVLADENFTVYAVDLLGHGQSDRPMGADYGIAAQSEYLDRALTQLRVMRAAVGGVDLGAAVALHLAATRAERVERLLLINPIAYDQVPARDVAALQRYLTRFAFRARQGVLGVAPILTPILEGSVADPAHMPPRLVARYLAPFVGAEGVDHLVHLSRAIREEDLEELEMEDVEAPALIVRGDEDAWTDRGVAEQLAAELPRSNLVTLDGVARLVPEEAPERLAELLMSWLGGGSVAAAAAV